MAPTSRSRKTQAYDAIFRLRNEHPSLHRLLTAANRVLRVRPPVRFEGWGMSTTHRPPWETSPGEAVFRQSLELARDLEFTGEAGITSDSVDTLAWRHWVVAFAARYAATMADTGDEPLEGIEVGVADGTTAHFAVRELLEHARGRDVRLHLYDAWDAIRSDTVLPSEAFQAGRYAGLSVDITRRNLATHEAALVWHVGYVPDAFDDDPPPPARPAYVHVDLNASQPTRAVCERVWPTLAPGGVMLFDDYGWLGFEDTKQVVDDFALDAGGLLLTMPTAQALLLRPR